MKEISKYLIKFLKKNFINKNKDYWEKQKHILSDTSKHILENILDDIELCNQSWENNKNNIKEEIIKLSKKDLPKGNSFNYISKEIRDVLENREKVGRKYTFTINHQNIILYLIYPFHENDPINKVSPKKMGEYLNECLHKIYLWLCFANKIRHKECSRSEEHTSELQSNHDIVCRLLLEKKK